VFEIIENSSFDYLLNRLGESPTDSNGQVGFDTITNWNAVDVWIPTIARNKGVYETSYPRVNYKQGLRETTNGYPQSSCQYRKNEVAEIQGDKLTIWIQGKRQKFSQIELKHPVIEFQVRRLS